MKRYPRETVILTEGAAGRPAPRHPPGTGPHQQGGARRGEEALTILGPGEFFGEVEFFDGAPASAHAIAHTDCEVLTIPHDEVPGPDGQPPGR